MIEPGTGAAAGSFDLQQQGRNMSIDIKDKDRRENWEGAVRGTVKDNRWCNDRVEKIDEIEAGSRNRKRFDSVSPLSCLIRNCPGTTDLP